MPKSSVNKPVSEGEKFREQFKHFTTENSSLHKEEIAIRFADALDALISKDFRSSADFQEAKKMLELAVELDDIKKVLAAIEKMPTKSDEIEIGFSKEIHKILDEIKQQTSLDDMAIISKAIMLLALAIKAKSQGYSLAIIDDNNEILITIEGIDNKKPDYAGEKV